MKTAFVTQRIIANTNYPETREALDIELGRFLAEANILPIPLSISLNPKKYFERLKPDLVILSGGNDLSLVNPKDEFSQLRDRYEKELLKETLKLKIPIFGICRGMQFLASELGFKLVRTIEHTKEHNVSFQESSIFLKAYSKETLVNSYHNWAIEPDAKLSHYAAAYSKDGFVEALYDEKKNIFAVMWHPERESKSREADIKFLKFILKDLK